MFRLWAKILKDNRILKDYVSSTNDYSISRTDMVLNSLSEICHKFDLAKPIWLNSNIDEFKKLSKTRFYNDSFIESIEFDYLEIQVIEE